MALARVRFSLLTILLLTAIVSLSIVVAKLWSEVGPLRAQVRSMRTELGLLNIDDSSVAQAIQLGTGKADHWKWRIYLPATGEYELFVYSGMIPPRGFYQNWYDEVRKNASGMSSTFDGGEFVFNVQLKKQDDQWLVLTSRGIDRMGGVWSVHGDWLSQLMGRGITSSVGPDTAVRFRPGQPIHLMTLLEPIATKNGNTTYWSTPTGPANGIVVWIEQHSRGGAGSP
jgi:hypothetical protein